MAAPTRKRVAIVGSGMAGLVTAYLLNRDRRQLYDVTLFESGDKLSLDSASISVPTRRTQPDRIDLPMRAFAGGFYGNLRAMYDYLGVEYHPQQFIFTFAKSVTNGYKAYFAHPSNSHQIPPPKARGISLISYLVEVFYLMFWHGWFSLCCYCQPPHTRERQGSTETLDQYLRRIKVPTYFRTQYILPLMSSVATCSHDQLLQFPAADLVTYKRSTHRAHHYTVTDGVKSVESKLSKLLDTNLSSVVVHVRPQSKGCKVLWRSTHDPPGLEIHEEDFDIVVLAVTPDVVGKIFEPLAPAMVQIPTTHVESVVHSKNSVVHELSLKGFESSVSRSGVMEQGKAQNIVFGTFENCTESVHVQPSGLVVTTCPITPIDPSYVLQSSRFTRVLRSCQSREVINGIFEIDEEDLSADCEKGTARSTKWRNGDSAVYLAGGWCWDGMVLLEGCVVSAMRVADALGVEIPWRMPRR